ncbi:MAG TPA: quinone-dependent dihydroorotate dehydrogenase [Chloroflexota bacterium]|nr:quinone-dependent dihydroorotate dehydrogenase [Chloroflexota bacterium]
MSRSLYRNLLFPLLTLTEPEVSHDIALRALGAVAVVGPLVRGRLAVDDARLRMLAFGLELANPVGLSAGFDKNAVAVRGLAALGFGHVEVGTVTPRPQPGRPKPRLFRLKKDKALINRLGFPSLGALAVANNLRHLARRNFVLGANVGPNADSVGVEDFVASALALAPHADYVTVNVSSPNTSGLRGMQQADTLATLLEALDWLPKPLLVKIAPDLSEDELGAMVEVIQGHKVAGVIATNTTTDRPPNLESRQAAEAGGLSGLPLRGRATEVIRFIYRVTEGKLPIIGAGGIATAADAIEKLEAGASLIQLYTGFIYEGPSAVRAINQGLLRALDARGLSNIGELVGSRV